MNVLGRIFILLIALLSVASLLPVATQADTVEEIREQIESINEERAKLDEEIRTYEKQLQTISGNKQTLQSAIQTLDVSRSKTSAQIKSIQQKISAANLRLDELALEISDKEKSIAVDQAALAASLRAMAVEDDYSIVERLVGSRDFSDAWTSIDQLAALSETLRSHTLALSEAKVALHDQHEAVADTRVGLSASNQELSSQKQALDVNRQGKAQLLTQTQAEEAQYQKLLADKRAEAASFQSALYDLSSKLQYIINPDTVPVAGKGVLRWPVADAYITQNFGKTSDSGRLYASGYHDGIDLRAQTGTPIYASLSGTVMEINLGAVQNCQYGKWVLIKHANGLATLYAHLSTVSVEKGDAVGTGAVIGYAGMTGYATGPHLHFTVYYADAVNFRQYTCKSGYTVTIPIAAPNAYLDPMSYL